MMLSGRKVSRLYLLVLISFDCNGRESSMTLNSCKSGPSSDKSVGLSKGTCFSVGESSSMLFYLSYKD